MPEPLSLAQVAAECDCETSLQPFGDSTVIVCYDSAEYEPGGEYCPPSGGIEVTGAMIHGHHVDAVCFSERVVRAWELAIYAEHEARNERDAADWHISQAGYAQSHGWAA